MIEKNASLVELAADRGLRRGIGSVLRIGTGQIIDSPVENVSRFYSVCREAVTEFLGGRRPWPMWSSPEQAFFCCTAHHPSGFSLTYLRSHT